MTIKEKRWAKKFDDALSAMRKAAKKAGLSEQKIDGAIKTLRKSSLRMWLFIENGRIFHSNCLMKG